ncbi:MAG TPA: cupin domain-containing protein [Acidimicrobiales bacterium]|nr:cupin domain-containing protein [Acidimicrobiales bacterium]
MGENSQVLADLGQVAIEHILSGTLPSPVDYDQSHDEWVLVLEGGAVLEVRGERFDLGRGDWVLLPAKVPHRLVETRPGTSWLAVHCFSDPVSASAGPREHE